MDSSPVYPYLLFPNADEFHAADKVKYAIRHAVGQRSPNRLLTPRELREHHRLVRSIEDLELTLLLKDTSPMAVESSAPFDGNHQSSTGSLSHNSGGLPSSFTASSAKGICMTSGMSAGAEEEIWDNGRVNADLWNWPVEALHQQYSLLIAIDFGASSFCVSGRGRVLVDYVPCAVKTVLDVISTTLKTRRDEMSQIKRWVQLHVEESEWENVLGQVWDPVVDVTIILINVPVFDISPTTAHDEMRHLESVKVSGGDDNIMDLFPETAQSFNRFERGFSDETINNCTWIPLVTRCAAEALLRDSTLISRLGRTLSAYEEACRAQSCGGWPDVSLFTSIEHLVRLVPERSSRCTSVVLLTNAGEEALFDNYSLLESCVRRKNIILSILLLSEAGFLQGSNISLLSRFLLSVGGFAVHLDQWLSLGAHWLNVEWCRRFVGSRCLAQQLLVQLETKFPINVLHLPQNVPLTVTSRPDNHYVLYDASHGLEDFSLPNTSGVVQLLRCIAEGKVNEGWSVVMNYSSDASQVAHLYARWHCNMKRGRLIVSYEMDISYPVVHRCVCVSGTRLLVDQFVKAKGEDRGVSAGVGMARTSWATSLAVMRSQFDGWMRAEEVAVQCLRTTENPPDFPILDELRRLSSREGVSSWWLSYCNVRSIGIFFRWDDETLRSHHSYTTAERICVPSVTGEAIHVLRAALKKNHRLLGGSEGSDIYIFGSDKGDVQYVVQTLLLDEPTASERGSLLAVGFELRFSFFLRDAEGVERTLAKVAGDVKACLSSSKRGDSRITGRQTLVVEVEADERNRREVHFYNSVVSCQRFEQLCEFHGSSASCSALSDRVASRRSHVNELRSSSGLVGKVKATRTAHKFVYQASLSPYIVSPWVLADALVLHWVVETAGAWGTFANASFNLFVMRRIRDGFRLLYCMAQYKAVLHVTRAYDEHDPVDVFDVVVAPPGTADGRRGSQIILYRVVRPFKFGVSPRYRSQLISDILKDIQANTVFHTFEALSASAVLSTEGSSQQPKDLPRGCLGQRPQPQLLLQFCSPDCGYSISLPILSSRNGEEAGNDLRVAVQRLVSLLCDDYTFVSESLVPESLQQRLYGTVSLKCDAPVGIPPLQQQQLLVCVLRPAQCCCVTLLLVPGPSTVPSSGGNAREVTVHVLSLDAAALYEGVMRHYGRITGDVDKGGVHSCSDNSLRESLNILLTSFSSLHVGSQFLRYERSHQGNFHDLRAIWGEEMLRVFTPFQDYFREIDVSYLIFMHHGSFIDCTNEEPCESRLESLIASLLQSASLRPMSTNPTVFLRATEVVEDVQVEEGVNTSNVSELTNVPFLMKLALLRVSEPGYVNDCAWISAPCEGVTGETDCVKLLLDIFMQRKRYHQKQRLVLQCFIKTSPCQLFDVAGGERSLTPQVARDIFRKLQETPRTQGGSEPASNLQTFFAEEMHTETLQTLRRWSLPYEEIPMKARLSFDSLIWGAISQMVQYSLTESLKSQPFEELRNVVMGGQTSDAEEGLVSDSGQPNKVTSDANAADARGEGVDMEVLAHDSVDVVEAVSRIVGLSELMSVTVIPALLSVPCFELDSFTVQFTRQPACADNVEPSIVLRDVFTRCLSEDLVCVVPASDFCYLFIPNRRYFSSWWLMIDVRTVQETATECRLRLLCNKPRDPDVCGRVGKHLRRLIEARVREANQMYLLRQLRDTQSANKELIPFHWGNQFNPPAPINKNKKGSGPPTQLAMTSMPFHCRGVAVRKIPVYYKLQHQCQKVLNRITNSSSRLELINIYNREQCFIVADDAQKDTFHYIRLVFVKDTSSQPSVTEPAPRLSPADCCPWVVVQLFSATKNALVSRPLRKLEDFLYLLAVQELRDHLNYVQHKVISSVDLNFLQYKALDPITVDLKDANDDQNLDETDTQLAFALVVLSLHEMKFKHFEVESEQTGAFSNFMEYYKLQMRTDRLTNASTAAQPVLGDVYKCGWNALLRFVKVIEKEADVLVSCSVQVNNDSRLVVSKFLTKAPGDWCCVGDSEKTYLMQIDDAVSIGLSRWRFFIMTRGFGVMTLSQVVPAVDKMLDFCTSTLCANSAVLRLKKFSLDRVSLAVFPLLVERLVGVLEPLSPVCFVCKPNNPPSFLVGFPWRWCEELQGGPQTEHAEFVVVCGFHISVGGSGSTFGSIVPVTRAMRVIHPDLPVSKTPALARSQFLLSQNIKVSSSGEPRALIRISLAEGLSVCLLDLLDSDNWMQLVGHVVAEVEKESDLMHDIMVQRLGLSLPARLTESILVSSCCGSSVDVPQDGWINVRTDECRWTGSNVRLPPQSTLRSDMLTIVMEGLCNRGLLANDTIRIEDAVTALYNECPQLSLRACHDFLRNFVREGVFKVKHKSLTFRTGNTVSLAEDVMTACAFRRHVHGARLLIESQHWQKGNADSLQQIESFWCTARRDGEVRLAQAVVSLQSHNKQIYCSRVSDFTLRSRTHWQPSDDILPPSLPRGANSHSEYCPSVDSALQSYVQHIHGIFPTARVVDLDPRDTTVTSDATLLCRFRCRYGKMADPQGGEITFVPHLYYVLVPVADTVKMMGLAPLRDVGDHWIVKGGLFIVEIGFQVVHFALDVFMVSGCSLSDGTAANAATWFKRKLMFSTVLYDLTVWRLLHCVQMYATHLPGQWQTSDAIENLVKYYPNPPNESLNVAAVFDLDEPKLRRLRRLMPNEQNAAPGVNAVNDVHLQQLIPEQGELLHRESTGEKYQYCGLMLWRSLRLLVLVSTLRDVAHCDRRQNSDLYKLVMNAKSSLLRMLIDSTLRQQLQLTWKRFLTPPIEAQELQEGDVEEALQDLRVLQTKSARVSIVSFLEPFLSLDLNWANALFNSGRYLSRLCFNEYALHLLPVDGSQTRGGAIMTLGSGSLDCGCLVVVEFSRCEERGVIENGVLYRSYGERITSTSSMSEAELELVECVLGILSSLLWSGEAC
ncbi:uncharacterized protein TEOVI_000318400 [Trypanosoma equiperdum]|uniref:Uncharacterized protein n=1 Tax=Trypanosoma equiperdum TaxID=5694 RepID=A0A1G4IGQ9_TRYEQ|nr:hypothetical protein, conserved [Trypanosoma equiperdum]